jgi:hypothetical protein
MFFQLSSGSLTEPLWDTSALGQAAYPSNEDYVGTETVNLLSSSFPNINPVEVHTSCFLFVFLLLFFISSKIMPPHPLPQVNAFVRGLFTSRNDLQVFKNHLRDFLVQTKEFSDKVLIFPLLCNWTSFSATVVETEIEFVCFCALCLFQDNKELYADETAAQIEQQRQQMMQVPGLIAPASLPYDNRMESWIPAGFTFFTWSMFSGGFVLSFFIFCLLSCLVGETVGVMSFWWCTLMQIMVGIGRLLVRVLVNFLPGFLEQFCLCINLVLKCARCHSGDGCDGFSNSCIT